VNAVMVMYEGAQDSSWNRMRSSKTLNVKVGLHQGSVLSTYYL